MIKNELTAVFTALDHNGNPYVINEYTEFELGVGLRLPRKKYYRLALRDTPVKRINDDQFMVGESTALVTIR